MEEKPHTSLFACAVVGALIMAFVARRGVAGVPQLRAILALGLPILLGLVSRALGARIWAAALCSGIAGLVFWSVAAGLPFGPRAAQGHAMMIFYFLAIGATTHGSLANQH